MVYLLVQKIARSFHYRQKKPTSLNNRMSHKILFDPFTIFRKFSISQGNVLGYLDGNTYPLSTSWALKAIGEVTSFSISRAQFFQLIFFRPYLLALINLINTISYVIKIFIWKELAFFHLNFVHIQGYVWVPKGLF